MKIFFLVQVLLALPVNIEATAHTYSCIGENACSNVQGTIGSDSCNGLIACSGATDDVGDNSCNGHNACGGVTGGVGDYSCNGLRACKGMSGSVGNYSCQYNDSCQRVKNAIIADDSCNQRQSCALSIDTIIESESCVEQYSCFGTQAAYIDEQSCNAGNACQLGTNIYVGRDSCNGWSACRELVDITIGQNSCNGRKACFDKPKVNIGNDACNCEECCNCEDPMGSGQGEDVPAGGCNDGECCGLSPSSSPSATALGSISGNVKGDDNDDDIGDTNLSGVLIMLLDSGGVLVATTETGHDGNYVFYDVPLGSYGVTETNIASYPFDVSDIDLGDDNVISVAIDFAAGVNSTDNDFVDEPSRTISGQVLEGDYPIPMVTVSLSDETGATVATTVTDTSGDFAVQVPPGTYTVVQTNIPDFCDVSPNNITVDVGTGGSTDNLFVVDCPRQS